MLFFYIPDAGVGGEGKGRYNGEHGIVQQKLLSVRARIPRDHLSLDLVYRGGQCHEIGR